jgi:mannan endo-1,4-beta-mannosidase
MFPDRRRLVAAAGAAVLSGAGQGASAAWSAPRVKPRLSNPKATPQARALYRYLNAVWGHNTLTGQQESTWRGGPRHELDYILAATGKQPAILGLDYIDPHDRDAVNARATHWRKALGGIVTLCWHWGNPMIGPGYENSKIAFDAVAALKTGTPERAAMMRDLSEIAGYLGQLQDAGVPVIWRPFHEFTGDWFWWGKLGPEVFKALWLTMHDYFTRERGLNNLIWLLGYTAKPDPAWYPGRAHVDLIGADTYVKDHGSQKPLYDAVAAITGDAMPIALHECGPIPDPDLVIADRADWLYFLTWHSNFIDDGVTNPPDFLKRVYNCERYLTLDRLPHLP